VAEGARRTAPVAVGAADQAALNLLSEAGEADLSVGELHDGPRLRPDVIEVQDADVRLAAVDASGYGQYLQGEPHVTRLCDGPPSNRREVRRGAAPTAAPRGPAAMAVGAHDLAAGDLGLENGEQHAAPHQGRDLGALRAQMVELQDDRIRLAAVDARARAKECEHEGLRFFHARCLERVVPTAVTGPLLGVVGLEAVATPPLKAGSMTVERALTAQSGAA
jgi:hypothetical protein